MGSGLSQANLSNVQKKSVMRDLAAALEETEGDKDKDPKEIMEKLR